MQSPLNSHNNAERPSASPHGVLVASANNSSAGPQQAAAMPFRLDPDGNIWLLLITNHRGEWIVPKGMIDPNRTSQQAALNEALEEAGIIGALEGNELGHFKYAKAQQHLTVVVHAMRVERVLVRWLEQNHREREWFPIAEAIERLQHPDLRRLARALQDRLKPKRRTAA